MSDRAKQIDLLTNRPTPRKPKGPVPRGYAAPPGTGPAGETCGTCRHLVRLRYSKTYPKCALRRAGWTSGCGTDVLVRSPACSKWEQDDD